MNPFGAVQVLLQIHLAIKHDVLGQAINQPVKNAAEQAEKKWLR
jgi:hypothetical protein